MKKTAILGFGNPVRSDDAVGCEVIRLLKEKLDPVPEILTIIDMGTSAFEVLFSLKHHDRILLIDGVINSGQEDGSLFKLPAEEIQAAIQDDPMVFLHSLKWDQALSYAKKIMQNDFPKDNITVYLVSITDTRLSVGMSAIIQQSAYHLANKIIDDLELFENNGKGL
ncbi:hydrogenase maturation protease [Cecembia rubra]|uniref:Hydrogenase maturation protease n=1 Tax=Cecembia rubra TaxID=1485585 RepID=A0A2P8E368_9BACT|nr:hydrogenase maturation protease [Cecembia rubra]PSL03857.1 hydrogenase maturation protease [Cecembia rubra]